MLSTLENPGKVLPKGTLPELEAHPGYVVAHFQTKAIVQVLAYAWCCFVPCELCHVACERAALPHQHRFMQHLPTAAGSSGRAAKAAQRRQI